MHDVTFSPDGQQLLSGGADTSIILWDASSGQPIHTFAGHTSDVYGVAFVDEGAAVVSGSGDLSLRKWDVVSGEQLQLRETGTMVDGMSLSPDGHNFIYFAEHVIVSLDPSQFDGPHEQLLGHENRIYDTFFSKEGQLLLSASKDGTVRIWSLGGRDVQQMNLGFPAVGVAVSPDETTLAVSSWGPEATLWDLPTRKPMQMLGGVTGLLNPGAITISADGRFVAGAGSEYHLDSDAGSVVVWNIETGNIICDFQEHVTGPRTVAFAPQGMTLMSGSMGMDGEGDLFLWDGNTCKVIRRLPTNDNVAGVDFSADGRLGLSSSNTGQITLWNLETGEAIRVFEVPGDVFLDGAFGPFDETVLASALSGLIVQWDRETGEEVKRFVGHDGGVWSIDVSEDGRWLASGDDTGLVILWDLVSGMPLRRHHAQSELVTHLTFSPDDQTIYSASMDETLAIWHISDPSLEGLLAWIDENRYVRELTCAEREQYNVEPFCS